MGKTDQMIELSSVRGAIFDVDDTLLDNKPGAGLGKGLHEQSRLAAFRTVGEHRNIPALRDITPQQNLDAWMTSPVHSLSGAVWNYLYKSGLVDAEVLNPDNALLQEIVHLKNELHADILLREGEEVPGSTAFVKALAEYGLGDKLAVASSATRRDIDLYFGKVGLSHLFPGHRIISIESVTHTKPHPEIFDLAFASLGLDEADRAQVLAFEDDPRGIMSAKAAGLYVCAITTRYTKDFLADQTIAPDVIADSYSDFARMLKIDYT